LSANPFVYGEIVPSGAFVDREIELDQLTTDLADGQKVFLISPRRYGKSSLIRQVLDSLRRRRVVTLDLTVSSFSSYVAFLEGYTKALATLDSKTERTWSWLRDLFKSIRPEVRVESGLDGGTSVSVAFPTVRTDRDAARLAEEVFALPGKIADRLRRRVAVALDEFQAIEGFNGGSVEQALRAAVQQQRSVGYVFAGSEPSLMEHMIGRKRPFYKAGPVMRLEKIPADVFAAWVDRRMKDSGLSIEPGVGEAIVDLAGNLPYDVQRLAHESWDDAARGRKRRIALEDLHATLHRLLNEQATLFEAVWQRLTLAQRSVLRAVVVEQGRAILSADIRVRHRLGAASSVQAALAALQRLDLIARNEKTGQYAAVDSLMREWIVRKTH
jgi:hypothetical protein